MLIIGDRKFVRTNFNNEDEIERVVIANSEYIFGPSSIYFPKTLIKTLDGVGTIPDGYVIDLASRRWYIVEAELSHHSVWSHIAPQVAKQIIAAGNPDSRQRLVDLAADKTKNDPILLERFDAGKLSHIRRQCPRQWSHLRFRRGQLPRSHKRTRRRPRWQSRDA